MVQNAPTALCQGADYDSPKAGDSCFLLSDTKHSFPARVPFGGTGILLSVSECWGVSPTEMLTTPFQAKKNPMTTTARPMKTCVSPPAPCSSPRLAWVMWHDWWYLLPFSLTNGSDSPRAMLHSEQ